MKIRYLIIAALILLLGFVVVEMLRLEDRIRQRRVVEVILEDETKPLLENLPPERLAQMADSSSTWFIADGDYFSALHTRLEGGTKVQRWEQLFMKGVNMGVALPGKWPTEFGATYQQYLNWLIQIGRMNANTIRTYTILPPDFYRALAWYNLHFENRKLYLLQGVWAEEPPDGNYANAAFTREFLKEIRDAIDVVHGNSVRQPRKGHADGIYTADVSRYTIGWALGREWEPYSVTKTNRNDTITLPYGVFIDVLDGTPMEQWLAGLMEFTARYETQKYYTQRPISFVNWLTLDPMHHNRELGADDLENVDIEKFSATQLFRPGVFASYHVYPYYPDFIFLEEKYHNTLNHKGKADNFLAYLNDLKRHQQGMPLVIAEYGVPTSRGNAHQTPFVYRHGNYTEKQQADLTVLMTEDIQQSGCAGAICFEWIDEWFKNNWMVMELEQPQERRHLWHNVENPEQNYGILAMENRTRIIDGQPNDWGRKLNKPFIASAADPTWVYLAVNMPGIDFSRHNLYIAIDTYDKNLGEFRIPFLNATLSRGAEFLVKLTDTVGSEVMVDNPYSVYYDRTKPGRPGYRSVKNSDGIFLKQYMLSNPPIVDVLGDTSKRMMHDRGALRFGNMLMPAASDASFYWTKDGFLELRLGWQVLNVGDPSSRLVLDGKNRNGEIQVRETDGFHLMFFLTDKQNRPVKGFPNREKHRITWDKWEVPIYTTRQKPVYNTLAEAFRRLGPLPAGEITPVEKNHRFDLCEFYRGKEGAVTFAFDGRCYSQFSQALPMLKKYHLHATFSKTYYGPSSRGGTHYLQLMQEEFDSLARAGHEVRPDGPWVQQQNGAEVIATLPWKPQHPFYRVFSDSLPDLHQADSILQGGKGTWTIFLLRHVFEPKTKSYDNLIHLAGKEVQVVSPGYFEKLIRLGRNTQFWVAPFNQVANYRYVVERSKIVKSGYNNMQFITLSNALPNTFNQQPITVKYSGPARIIRVSGSASDGTFRVRGGVLFLDLWPNREATLEIIE
ncbi:MAG TPA: hypothetical protein P5228_01010 [Bacteroidales bacterium]|nr:hypothetical protein [Bacteroidales bacterium]